MNNILTLDKQLGIWMDHSNAHLIGFTKDGIEESNIISDFTHDDKIETYSRSENIMQNKERHKHLEYYKKIADVIKKFDTVLLFGPTDAKLELHNILKADHNFDKIKIEVKSAPKMSWQDQEQFVRKHFLIR